MMSRLTHYLFFIFFSLLSLSGKAQGVSKGTTDESGSDRSGTGVIFGVRVGGTISKFNHAQPHMGEKLGGMAGVFAEHPFSGKFSLQAELAYIQQGGSYTTFSDDTRFGDAPSISSFYITTSRITAQYADFALLAKYQFPIVGGLRPNITIGPDIGYNIGVLNNSERTYYYRNIFYTVNGYQVITSQYEQFQAGVTGGIGGEVSLGSKRFLIDFRFRYGLTPAKTSYSYINLKAVQGDLYTNSVYVMLGLAF
jgi:hypothetical protein